MAIAFTDKTNGGATSNGWTTASFDSTTGSVLFVVLASRRSGSTPDEPTISGHSLTWNKITTSVFMSERRVTMWYAVVTAGATGTIGGGTGVTVNNSWSVVEVSGLNIASPVVQSVLDTGADPNTATLAAFSDSNNATLAGIAVDGSSATIEAGTGFTLLSGSTVNQVAGGIEYKTTPDVSVDAGTSSGTTVSIIALELRGVSNFFQMF